MKLEYDFRDETPGGVVQYINRDLEKLCDAGDDNQVLFNGYNIAYGDYVLKHKYKNHRKKLLALWSPCEFLELGNPVSEEEIAGSYDWLDVVFCVCPYTTERMNEIYGEEKFKYIPYPFTNHNIMDSMGFIKDHTVCWFGGVHLDAHEQALLVMRNFTYKFMTLNIPPVLMPYSKFITHKGLHIQDKLWELSRCKAGLSFNQLQLQMGHIRQTVKYQNKAFDRTLIAPQFKVRTHEIASSHTLVVCQKDKWNLIEDFYTPDEEFIYFDSHIDLYDTLKDIDENYSHYEPIIENGYNRSQDYRVEKLFKYFDTEDESLITWRNGVLQK